MVLLHNSQVLVQIFFNSTLHEQAAPNAFVIMDAKEINIKELTSVKR
jgi:hypothetical protein